ncbi:MULTISPECIES: DUF302 domain-containing protein [Alphaproteobacteria]|uniref:Uncharacterized protein n=2 Tax=Alphaproteobacteria TaxID=28211 RepID=A0A512HIJ5_9HYPH|nr:MULTISPECIES: DUF302 domain-containing protein [Alphaproteobacteria]GEO85263.1 hypothetical protein RNA01_21950 [Ciceribacter naphthalenivorans]GLR20902.1 hypothetical protein GCM10007920_06870 [Ciceribacter naphthalenivorans]GLT03758.1 hypothetical protein GCM10007926_06870 [Sphingomonas psychrolutea]
MRLLRIGILATSAVLLSMPLSAAEVGVTSFQTDAPFAEVVADLEDAVVNRGYVIDYHGHIGDMLARTAADVPGSKPLYKAAEILQFCSATMSRQAMEADIGNIAYCPYVLFVYEPAKEPGKVTLGFRRLPAGDGRDEINTLLEKITREAAGL